MAKKKQTKKRNPAAKGPKPLRLSQCMIVKNEEKNIEKALSWAKDIAFEQIVVDTGSTDRTVEIAESMGAKVCHFEWINDFAAAKNYAIEQASGRWIAFLDADEYFPEDDARKLKEILESLTNDAALSKKYLAIECPLCNVDDEGKVFVVFWQRRIFRNLPDIRYAGKIHEALTLSKEWNLMAQELSIIHTGYAGSAHESKGKGSRNVAILEEELAKEPDNGNIKLYLADSLRIAGPAQDTARAEALYAEALESDKPLYSDIKQGAYTYLIGAHFSRGETERAEELCRRAVAEYSDVPDFHYYLGGLLCDRQDYAEAWEALKKSEELLNKPIASVIRGEVISNPKILFAKMAMTAQKLEDKRNAVYYSTLALKEDKYEKGILAPLIQMLTRDENTSDEDIFGLLNKLYDFTNVKDKVTLLASSRIGGNRYIYDKARAAFTEEELEWLTVPPYETDTDELSAQDVKST